MATQNLNNILKEFQSEIPSLQATAIVGSDGLVVADLVKDRDVDIELIGAQMSLLMSLVKKASARIGSEAQENLLSTEQGYLIISALGKNFMHGVVIPKEGGGLAAARLAMRDYAERITLALAGNS